MVEEHRNERTLGEIFRRRNAAEVCGDWVWGYIQQEPNSNRQNEEKHTTKAWPVGKKPMQKPGFHCLGKKYSTWSSCSDCSCTSIVFAFYYSIFEGVTWWKKVRTWEL